MFQHYALSSYALTCALLTKETLQGSTPRRLAYFSGDMVRRLLLQLVVLTRYFRHNFLSAVLSYNVAREVYN